MMLFVQQNSVEDEERLLRTLPPPPPSPQQYCVWTRISSAEILRLQPTASQLARGSKLLQEVGVYFVFT